MSLSYTLCNILNKYNILAFENDNIIECIENFKNIRQTRSTSKNIGDNIILSRKNIFDRVRFITEICYYVYEYDNDALNDSKFCNDLVVEIRELQNNLDRMSQFTPEENLIIKAFKDELESDKKQTIEPKTITEICHKYDRNLIEIASKDDIYKNEFVPTNIKEICDRIHIDLTPNYNEINVLFIIANYLLNNPELDLYKEFIFNCPEKFLFTYMNNPKRTPDMLKTLKRLKLYGVLDFLVYYIIDSKIKSWLKKH
jgi:hypothetical protein